jgi:CheY-like chemotaxis protein
VAAPENHLVLLVEDNEDMRDAVTLMLEMERFKVLTAANGAEALHRLRDAGTTPCMIVLDLHMPVMDGFAFRRAQMADHNLATVPVVVLSADGEAQRHARELRAAAVVDKSNLDSLVGVVRQICA